MPMASAKSDIWWNILWSNNRTKSSFVSFLIIKK